MHTPPHHQVQVARSQQLQHTAPTQQQHQQVTQLPTDEVPDEESWEDHMYSQHRVPASAQLCHCATDVGEEDHAPHTRDLVSTMTEAGFEDNIGFELGHEDVLAEGDHQRSHHDTQYVSSQQTQMLYSQPEQRENARQGQNVDDAELDSAYLQYNSEQEAEAHDQSLQWDDTAHAEYDDSGYQYNSAQEAEAYDQPLQWDDTIYAEYGDSEYQYNSAQEALGTGRHCESEHEEYHTSATTHDGMVLEQEQDVANATDDEGAPLHEEQHQVSASEHDGSQLQGEQLLQEIGLDPYTFAMVAGQEQVEQAHPHDDVTLGAVVADQLSDDDSDDALGDAEVLDDWDASGDDREHGVDENGGNNVQRDNGGGLADDVQAAQSEDEIEDEDANATRDEGRDDPVHKYVIPEHFHTSRSQAQQDDIAQALDRVDVDFIRGYVAVSNLYRISNLWALAKVQGAKRWCVFVICASYVCVCGTKTHHVRIGCFAD